MKLSICIPTNGVMEWICPVLESIYTQAVSESEYEVVIVDNGNNQEFQTYILEYAKQHKNLRYERIKCPIFMNEIYAYKLAGGDFIKFVNHRAVLAQGTLRYWIEFMHKNFEKKPVVYFANGVLDKPYREYYYDSFDRFVYDLGYWSSWSTGMAVWKTDLDTIPETETFNELFPHTNILLRRYKDKETYIIDNRIYCSEVKHTSKKKGKYDLFYAFAVEYPYILLKLLVEQNIKMETFLKLKTDVLDFVIGQYTLFCENKEECSYDLSSYEDSIKVFYSQNEVEKRKLDVRTTYQNVLNKNVESFRNSADGVVIYGAAVLGRKEAEKKRNELKNIICFIDNSPSKKEKLCMGIPVVDIETFKCMGIDTEVLVCVGDKYANEVADELEDLGINYKIICDSKS